MRRYLTIAALGALLFVCTGCRASLASSQSDFYAMDTFMTVTAYASDQELAHTAQTEIEQRINALDALMSRQRTESELARLNAANGAAVTVSPELYEVIKTAVHYAELTHGAYDPTTAPLSDLWAIGTEQTRVPEQKEIDAALKKVGWQKIHLLEAYQIQLADGAQLDLGGIGKGWAANDAAELCKNTGDDLRVLAQLGGNIIGVGENPNQDTGSWVIGVADPDEPTSHVATVTITDESVVTSGDYERYFEVGGKRYHHIFDPKTGYPAQSGLRSVTVVDADSAKADALTTALFVMGLERGLEFCAQHGVKAVFVTDTHEVISTEIIKAQYAFTGAQAGYTDGQ